MEISQAYPLRWSKADETMLIYLWTGVTGSMEGLFFVPFEKYTAATFAASGHYKEKLAIEAVQHHAGIAIAIEPVPNITWGRSLSKSDRVKGPQCQILPRKQCAKGTQGKRI